METGEPASRQRFRLERSGGWAAAAVGLLVLGIYVIPQVVNARVQDRVRISAATSMTVAGFRYTPAPTWEEVRTASRRGERSTITNGTVRLAVMPATAGASLQSTYNSAAATLTAQAGKVVGDGVPLTTASGLTGLRGVITGPGETGVLVVFLHGDAAVALTATAPPSPGIEPAVAAEVDRMIRSFEVEP
jgi:hypothetical protein